MQFPDSPALLADASDVFTLGLASEIRLLAGAFKAQLNALDRKFRYRLNRGHRYDPKQIKALSAITLGAAGKMFLAGATPADFFEQVEYSGRRLTKLNLTPREVARALSAYDAVLTEAAGDSGSRLPVSAEQFNRIRERFSLCVMISLNNAFHQVRQGEAQAFYDLFRAELEAKSLDELLRQFLENLTRISQAQVGRLLLLSAGSNTTRASATIGDPADDWCPKVVKKAALAQLSRTRYIVSGDRYENLILDRSLIGNCRSYWSIPLLAHGKMAGVIQLGFSTERSWLPRELQLLDAAVEQCLLAAEKARLVEDLAAREEQVRRLGEHMWQVEEEERRRISRELHDEAGQSMLFIRLQLEMLEKSQAGSVPELRNKLEEIRDVTERTIIEIRRIIAALSPAVLEQLGLVPALRQLTSRFRQFYPARVRLYLPPRLGRLPRESEIITYRLVQECYNNIAKHSSASTVNIHLSSTDRYLELRVEDDGVGFEVETALKKRNSFGLSGMRERVALFGGSLNIHSAPGCGTRINVVLPVRGLTAKEALPRSRQVS